MATCAAVEQPSREHVLRLLAAHYPAQDPPLYSGRLSWRAAAEIRGRELTAFEKRKNGRKRRVHVVFGRVACVSPVSSSSTPQRGRENAHFFVEVEVRERSEPVQKVVNVMFVGAANVRWHLFLRPGQQVLITDLVKVFSRECDIFLLQTTAAPGAEAATSECAPPQLRTQVFVWQEDLQDIYQESVNLQLEASAAASVPRQVGHPTTSGMLDCEGVVSRVLWNDCLEVQGNPGFLVCLFHFPGVDLSQIREGATIRVCNAHVMRWATPVEHRIVLGLCARSHFSVVEHGNELGRCLKASLPSTQHRSKILSCFGDRYTQPLSISFWLLEVFDALVTKFSFGPSGLPSQRAVASFPHMKQQEALRVFVDTLSIDVTSDAPSAQSSTLGNRFLSAHAGGVERCPSIRVDAFARTAPHGSMTTIRQLKEWGESQLCAAFADQQPTADSKGHWRIEIPAAELEWCLLVGCFSGNADSGDLAICDQTGSIPLSIVCGSRELQLHRDDSTWLFVIPRFELLVEAHSTSSKGISNLKQALGDGSAVTVVCISCSFDGVIRIPMGVSESLIDDAPDTVSNQRGLTILVTHIDPITDSSSLVPVTEVVAHPVYRRVHGIILSIEHSRDGSLFASERVEILINTDVAHWHLEKHGCYKISGAIREEDSVSSDADRQLAFAAATTEEKSIALTTQFFSEMTMMASHTGYESTCFQEWVDMLGSFNTSRRPLRASPLKLYHLEQPGSIEPLVFTLCDPSTKCGSQNCDFCARVKVNEVGVLELSQRTITRDAQRARLRGTFLQLARTQVPVSRQQLLQISLLQHFVLRAERRVQIKDLLRHPDPGVLHEQRRSDEDGGNDENGLSRGDRVEHVDLHRSRLYTLVGVITRTRFSWVDKNPPLLDLLSPPRKRYREPEPPETSPLIRSSVRELMCHCQVRDLSSLDTVEVRVNASRFGARAALRQGLVVEFSKLQGFVARSSYKVFVNWGNCSVVRVMRSSPNDKIDVPSDAMLYGAMIAASLNELYHSPTIDRTLHRWVVRVVYVSYVVLKRKCRSCYRALQLEKRQSYWLHVTPPPTTKAMRKCSWHQLQMKDPEFETHTYASMSMRCVIDDGSAQAELFLEDDVAWDLLGCSAGTRRRLEKIVHEHTTALSFFTSQMSASDTFAKSPFRDDEYYQNEFRSMIMTATQNSRSLAVLGQRFYSATGLKRLGRHNGISDTNAKNADASSKDIMSVLTFGKDIQIKAKTLPSAQLEARRVDPLHAKSELRQRLESLRRCMKPNECVT